MGLYRLRIASKVTAQLGILDRLGQFTIHPSSGPSQKPYCRPLYRVGDYYGQILRYKCASRYGMEAAANLFAFKASDLCVFVIYQGSFGVIFAGVQRALKPTSEEI